MWAKLALRFFIREFKRGELTIIFAAIGLAVLTIFSLSSITERISLNIEQKSSDFIASDRRLSSNYAFDASILDKATAFNLQTAKVIYFDSMLFANDELVLSSVKATTSAYPLRGKLTIKDSLVSQSYEVKSGPKLGNIWLSEGLFYSLDVNVGDTVELGAGNFIISKVLVKEPDAPYFSLSGNKRVLLNYQDVSVTQA